MRTFVTGATGLIGRFLLPRLLERGDVTVLARDRTPPPHPRLTVLKGDICQPKLGLDAPSLAFDHVIHLAALYDLRADAATLERVNVQGTQNLISALRAGGFSGTLHHVSSIAVAGDFEGTFGEDRLDVGQSHPHAYHRSKFEAERLIRDLEDVRWRIYRPSAVVGHSETGEMDRVDGPYFMFEAIDRLRDVLPRWMPLAAFQGTPINMVPVDWVAQTLDRLIHETSHDQKTFHLVDPEPPSFTESFNLVADAARAPRLPKKRGFIGRMIPRDLVSQMGSAKFLRRKILSDLGIPPEVLDVVNPKQGFESSVAPPPPPQHTYVDALWSYYDRHLASRKNKTDVERRYFDGKIALVTGASSGIGASLSRMMAASGAHVVAVARRDAELTELCEEIRAAGGSAELLTADLSDLDACDRVVQSVLETHGRLDVLINNAGRSIRRPLVESLDRFHDLERVMQINYFAPARLIRGFLPGMVERKAGCIVNVLSAGAHMPSPRFGAYTASKAALSQLGDTLLAEHAADDIQVTQAYLHWVRTPMMDATGAFEDNDAMGPDEAAQWIVDGMVSGKAKLLRPTDARRYLLNTLSPHTLSRLVNVVYRIYQETPDPELTTDRMLAEKVFKGRPM